MSDKNTQIECSICLQAFIKPKILPCFHSYCEECLDGHINAHLFYNRFKCPICRKVTEKPLGGACGFTNNFYITDTGANQKCFCEVHKQREEDFYCRQCCLAVCPKCALDNHKHHTVVELADVDEELRAKLEKFQKELEVKIATLRQESECLHHKISHINNTADTACTNVDKQIDKICKEAKTLGKEIKDHINKTREEEEKKVRAVKEDLTAKSKHLQTGVQYSGDVLKGQSTNSLVDFVPNVQQLTLESRKIIVKSPVVLKCHYFPSVDIDLKSLKQQLGRLQTNYETSFTTEFDLRKLKSGDELWGEVCVIQDLPWGVVVKQENNSLGVYFGLKQTDDKALRRCCATYSMKLVNKSDDSKSVTKQRTKSTFTPGIVVGWDGFYNWDEFSDSSSGFLVEQKFALHANVAIIT